LFSEYLEEYPQTFPTDAHRQRSYRNFVFNVQEIKRLNEKHAGKATFALGKFSMMSLEEFRVYLGAGTRSWEAIMASNMSHMVAPLSKEDLAAAPTSFDWRQHSPPVVTAIKDQGSCGDCWAFSTTGNIEGQWALAGHPLVSLSEQQLCDCDTVDKCCDGGMMASAFQYIIQNGGIDTETSYPYKAAQGRCKFSKSTVGAKIRSYKMLPHDPVQMAAFLATSGPISVAVDATTWQNYESGVIKSGCGTSLDHAVLIVGYDTTSSGTPYWIVKNQWGLSWGMDGYVYVERGNDNMCGIDKYPITSVV